MGLLLGLIRREFATRPRRRFFYWRRFGLIALFLVWLIYNCLIGAIGGRTGTTGLVLFASLAKVTMLAVLLLAPFIAGDLIMREKEDRTLGLLYLTAITPGHLLAAKLGTALLTSGALALGVLPLFVLSVSIGGIATEQILLAFLLLGCSVFAATALGLWAGTRARNSQAMGSLLGGVILVVGVVVPAGFAFIHSQTQWLAALDFWPENRWLAVLSPYLAMREIASGIDLRGPWWACLVCLAFGLLFLVLAAHALSRQLAEEPTMVGTLLAWWCGRQVTDLHDRYPRPTGNPVPWRDYCRLHGGALLFWCGSLIVAAAVALLCVSALWVAKPSLHLGSLSNICLQTVVWLSVVFGGLSFIGGYPRPTANPVLWRDYYFVHGGPRRIWGRFLVVAAVVGLLSELASLMAKSEFARWRHPSGAWFWTMLCLSVALGGLGFIGSHARCLTRERSSRAVDLLLTTDLAPVDILGGKQWAILLAFVPWLLMALIGAACVVRTAGYVIAGEPELWSLFFYACVAVCVPPVTAFGHAAVGLYFALRPPYFATVATFGSLVIGITLYLITYVLLLLLARSLGLDDALLVFAFAALLLGPPLVLGVVLRRYLYRQFRTLVADMPR